jgi:site-specific recombinase XerD
MIDANVHARVGQEMMRHATLSTMANYAQVRDHQLVAALEALPAVVIPGDAA